MIVLGRVVISLCVASGCRPPEPADPGEPAEPSTSAEPAVPAEPVEPAEPKPSEEPDPPVAAAATHALRLGNREVGIVPRKGDVVVLDSTTPFSASTHRWTVSELKCGDALLEGLFEAGVELRDRPEIHFDNCEFDAALDHIRLATDRAHGYAAANKLEPALFELGSALHTLQDFYARSNYIELAAARGWAGPEPLELFSAAGREQLESLRTESGAGGRLETGIRPDGSHACGPEPMTKKELAKDDCHGHGADLAPRFNKRFYVLALQLAQRETVAYLNSTMATWDLTKRKCGSAVPFAVLQDEVCE